MEGFFASSLPASLPLFLAYIVVQVLIFGVTGGLIGDAALIHTRYRLDCCLTGKVIVEIAVDIGVFFQLHQCLFQITD